MLVGASNQEEDLVGASSVIVKTSWTFVSSCSIKQATPMDCSEQGTAARKQRRSLVGKLQHSGGKKGSSQDR